MKQGKVISSVQQTKQKQRCKEAEQGGLLLRTSAETKQGKVGSCCAVVLQ